MAISVDPSEVTREHIAKMGWTYTFLSDPKAEVIRRYDLLHPGGGQAGDISRPAEILVDPTGTVRWVDLTDNYWVRTRPETVLRAYDRLDARGSLNLAPEVQRRVESPRRLATAGGPGL